MGMKLEAKDRKNPGLICVATITEIDGRRLLIHFDGWSKFYDYWCEPNTVDIHPIGWCDNSAYELQKPHGEAICFGSQREGGGGLCHFFVERDKTEQCFEQN